MLSSSSYPDCWFKGVILSPVTYLFQIVLPREGKELDFTVKGYILCIPYGIFCRYRVPGCFNYLSNDSPLLLLVLSNQFLFVQRVDEIYFNYIEVNNAISKITISIELILNN